MFVCKINLKFCRLFIEIFINIFLVLFLVSVFYFRMSCIKYFVIYFVFNIIEYYVIVFLFVDVLVGKDIFVYNKYI